MTSILRKLWNGCLWLPKHLALSHYVIFVHLTTPNCQQARAERRCAAMAERLFGDAS